MKDLLANLRARWTAKKFNIWTESIDPKRKNSMPFHGDWLAADGKIYYGNRFLVFFESDHNEWWLLKNQAK